MIRMMDWVYILGAVEMDSSEKLERINNYLVIIVVSASKDIWGTRKLYNREF